MNDSFKNPSAPHRTVAGLYAPIFKTVVLIYLIRLFCACSFYQPTVSLAVDLPPLPEHWQTTIGEPVLRILYPTEVSGSFEERWIDGPTPILIQLPKAPHLPVLAYPYLPGRPIELAPAGGLYPLDCDVTTNTISLSWRQGAAAEVLYRLWNQGVDCSAINVPRLTREIWERCQGDPWALDLDRLCNGLAAETFRVTDIRLASSRDLLLEPGPGGWSLESPFRTPVQASADGFLFLQSVPLGGHILFEDTSVACFFLYVGEDTTLLIRR